MLHALLLRLPVFLIVCVVCVHSATAQFRVRLKSGGFLAGELVPATVDGFIAVRSKSFETPIEMELQSLRSIDPISRESKDVFGEQTFVFANGTSITGKLTGLDSTSVKFDSMTLGKLEIPIDRLYEIHDTAYRGRLVYSGPRSFQEWTSERIDDWAFEAGAIATAKSGAAITGDVRLPDKSQILLSLSWTKNPDFVLALGCSKNEKSANVAAALRLEIFDGSLAMVREVGKSADLALVSDFSVDSNRLNLILYLDQTNGIAAACSATGRLLEKIEMKSEKGVPGECVRLSNHSQQNQKSTLRLEKLEIREWDGHLPQGEQSQGQIVTKDGRSFTGNVTDFDAATGELTIADGENRQRIKLVDLKRASLQSPKAESQQDDAPRQKQAKEDPQPNELPDTSATKIDSPFSEPAAPRAAPIAEESPADAPIEIELEDRSRLTGKWLGQSGSRIKFAAQGIQTEFQFELSKLVGLAGNLLPAKEMESVANAGKLFTDDCELLGYLVHGEGGASNLYWRAEATSDKPVAISPAISGRIEYSPPKAGNAKKSTAMDAAQLRRNAERVVQGEASTRRKNLSLGLEFRSGDVISGVVKSIDERGVTFQSDSTATTFVPHRQLTSVTMRNSREAINETPQKLERLMTVPRSMKLDPPTHLIISANGDYLRGRLVRLDSEKAVLEIRLATTEIPTSQIAQIFWLHDRGWETESSEDEKAEPKASNSAAFQVHAMRKDGRGVTFVPTALHNGKLMGTSELLGDCEVDLSQVQSIFFGSDVGGQVRAMKKDPWKLSLAMLPKVYQDGENQAEEQSPLVGKLAPNFKLQSVDNSSKELASLAGKIVVLDFWASWCGPCVKTMPEIDRIVKEVGGNEVELLAVNIQESRERVTAAVGRMGISATVLLDVDGEVAARYEANAIPQTVIIDREGNVAHLFVGGGSKFLESFEAALKSMVGGN